MCLAALGGHLLRLLRKAGVLRVQDARLQHDADSAGADARQRAEQPERVHVHLTQAAHDLGSRFSRFLCQNGN